jgi:hypothetical protein
MTMRGIEIAKPIPNVYWATKEKWRSGEPSEARGNSWILIANKDVMNDSGKKMIVTMVNIMIVFP